MRDVKMKFLKKTVVFALVAATLIAACAGIVSCGENPEDDKGELLATYKGGELYENDLEDWRQYMSHIYYDDINASDDVKAALYAVFDLTTSYVVKIKAFENLLEKEGYMTFSEKSINSYAETLIEGLDEDFKGGYDAWKKGYHVSDEFIYSFAEMQLVSAEIEKYVMSRYGVTDEMIDKYWELYAGDYVQVPSYYFDSIILAPDADYKGGEAEWEELKADAQKYIDEINAGADFEAVKAEAIANSHNPTVSQLYSNVSSITKLECRGFEDLETILADNKTAIEKYCEELEIEFVPYADPNGDKDQRDAWFYYVNMNHEAYVKNALLNLEEGAVWSEPIMSVLGYQILKITKIDEDVFFKKPSDYPEVYNDIYDKVYKELWNDGSGVAVTEFESDLAEDYDINIVYSYVSEYKKGNLK